LASSSADESLIGKTIAGKYVVEALLGSGAMGQVYKARQIALEKTVALKVMHTEIARDPNFAERFHREARAASRLDHPSSIRVLDFGEEPGGLTYIAMEYVEGQNLHAIIQSERPMSAERIADILIQTLSALAVAHETGVIHRDLKPENIMIVKGTDEEGRPKDVVKVCDFGVAKITSKEGRGSAGAARTTAGVIIGTPEYLSPEQAKGEPIDARSDIYAMGVILFELLTGTVPFTAENAIGILLKHVTQAPPMPSDIYPAVDRRLEAICLKAMSKAREDRFQSAREMRAELRAVAGRAPQLSNPLIEQDARETVVAPVAHATAVSLAGPRRTIPRSRAAWPMWVGFALLGAGVGLARLYLLPVVRGKASPPQASAELPRAELAAPAAPASADEAEPASPGASALAPSPAVRTSASHGTQAALGAAHGNAVVRVASVTGATADAVQAALPLGSFKDCYQKELRQGRRVEGHADLKIAFVSTGFFTSAQGFASPELSKVGQCCAEATLHTPRAVQNPDAKGGTADVTIVYSLQ
jgi:serine/threonine-protein kinase